MGEVLEEVGYGTICKCKFAANHRDLGIVNLENNMEKLGKIKKSFVVVAT